MPKEKDKPSVDGFVQDKGPVRYSREFNTREQADSYYSAVNTVSKLTDLLNQKETLIDYINHLPKQHEDTLEKCAELYEDYYDRVDLANHYGHMDGALRYALRLVDGEILKQADTVVKYIDDYRFEYDVEYKYRRDNALKSMPSSEDAPF